ncbi:monovalent cation/H(+) antiporter subunit G [Polymorphum gilvum]|uniref:Na+/H+ antiporter subunit G n=1 Tax=Polymorphum gilvum (strain LMG 25793 / CGMCC 1.9160 / SL003B-26A1) TaxID=991905 RepID=F2IV47_POLGS|nr:monovalent cation/H(+) antiporter subunit G [Polymorphum gilvum]ADZ71378.1 Na+/H+ antiporter subunit G [Polymorphum gilvum SL003B-26A1]
MNALIDILVGCGLVVGAAFALVASIGILRLQDVYMRMHAASKAGTLGSGLMLLALALHAGDLGVITRAVAGVIFFVLTAPVSAHLLATASYKVGYRPCAATRIDALADSKIRRDAEAK